MALFFTGKGDKGKSQIGRKKIPKDSPVIETLGELDELNSLIGLTKASSKERDFIAKLTRIQENLFIVQAQIAWFLFPKFKAPEMAVEKIVILEKEIEAIEKKIQPDRGFIISGSTISSAWLDYARAVARRVERRLVKLHKTKKLPETTLAYFNRLSSYLYALARLSSRQKESHPTYA
jgi:ATP:cob(I)alamin adenosyltransferase